MKIGLGTAQFGLQYGVNNRHGKPTLREVARIIRCAKESHITVLDTAADYGDSEETLGKLIPKTQNFQIVTKLAKGKPGRYSIEQSLKRLQCSNVHAILIHDFEEFRNSPAIWDDLIDAKKERLVEKIGFSLYFPAQLEFLIDKKIDFDIIQVPYNVLDRRFQRYFSWTNEHHIDVHTRSVFLQGLVFTEPAKLHPFFNPIRSKLRQLISLAADSGKSIESLCLNFVNAHPFINTILIGVDTVENLERNIAALAHKLTSTELEILESLEENNEQMILPFNWKIT